MRNTASLKSDIIVCTGYDNFMLYLSLASVLRKYVCKPGQCKKERFFGGGDEQLKRNGWPKSIICMKLVAWVLAGGERRRDTCLNPQILRVTIHSL